MLVGGEVVGEARDARVHLGAAEGLVVGLLAGRHLHQRRTAEEDLGAPVDEHGVVAHARDVGPARGGVAEHQGDRRDRHRGQLGELVEDPPGRDEQVGLGREVGPAGLDEVDHRQPVGAGDLQGAQGLAQRVRVHRPAAHRRVVPDDQALDAVDDADARQDRGADGEVGAPRGEGRELEEGGVGVEQQREPLADRELAALAVALHVAVAAAGDGELELLVERGDDLELGLPVADVALGGGVEERVEDGHRSAASVSCRSSGRRGGRGRRSSGSSRWRSAGARR